LKGALFFLPVVQPVALSIGKENIHARESLHPHPINLTAVFFFAGLCNRLRKLLPLPHRKDKTMYISPAFTNPRSRAADEFSARYTSGWLAALWADLTGKTTRLLEFPEPSAEKAINRKYVGLIDLPVTKVVGSVGRKNDFDDHFRPLKRNLLGRWVNVYLCRETAGWPPILVYKLGERYYVEDGHHRISVSRALGLTYIDAIVWEYPCPEAKAEACQPAPQWVKSPAQACQAS
jgi:hypothetical protein